MGSLSRATNETTRGMRAFVLLLLVAATLSDALSTLNGRVDEEHNAIVVEALPNVRPVCLAEFNGPDLAQQTATVVGWGSLRENGPQPNILQEVTVRIWDNKVCKDTYGPAAPGGIMDHMLCA